MTVRISFGPRGKTLETLAANFLIAAGVLAFGFSAWALLSGQLYQQIQKARFGEQSSAEPPFAEPPVAEELRPAPARLLHKSFGFLAPDPLVIGQLEIPRIGLDVMVREGVDDGTLLKAAGHVPSTALPGEAGDFMVLGHRDTVFRPLRAIERGDEVRMRTKRGRFTFHIDSVVVVDLAGLRIIQKTPREGITLITCFPFNYWGPAPNRLVARGSLTDSVPSPLP